MKMKGEKFKEELIGFLGMQQTSLANQPGMETE